MGTASALLDQAIRRLNELSTSSPVRWTRAELLVFLNDAMAELNLIAADYQDTHTIPINNTTSIWDLPEAVIAPFSVRVSNGYLLRQQIEDLDKESNWESPSEERQNPKSWSTLGLEKIVITPRPINAMNIYVETLTQYTPVTDAPIDLSSWLRAEYELALEDFIVSRAMFKEGGAELQQGLMFYNRFLDTVQQLSGRNIIRRYPAWDVQPEAKMSETTPRQGAEPQG